MICLANLLLSTAFLSLSHFSVASNFSTLLNTTYSTVFSALLPVWQFKCLFLESTAAAAVMNTRVYSFNSIFEKFLK